MTFWLKVKKFFGLLDEEKERAKQNAKRRAAKAERRNRPEEAKTTKPAPKQNTRVAKGAKGAKPEAGAEGTNERPPVTNPRVYVGNLSFDVTEYDLEDLFKGIGNVKKVEIIYNKNTHRSKGYGFIEMYNIEDAKRSVEVLNDQPFMGRNMIVNGAKARPKKQAPRKQDSPKAEAPVEQADKPATDEAAE